MNAKKSPEPGLVLAGRYRLELKLGEGGMGTVWRAEHLVLCAPVAVKILDRDVSSDPEAHDRFIREARSAAALRSPHVVQTLDYGIDDGFPYIAMELLEGETLATRLTRSKRLPPMDTARIITQVARAVGRAHEGGIIHRDLKPENVFLVKNEDVEVAKVLDFGVAKVETASLGPKGTRTRTGSLLGTPFYMSPEQAQGNKTIDPRSDIWSLGVITFECLTGKRPFESEGLGDLVLQICVREIPKLSEAAGLPKRFDAWFEKACARDPEARFQTAKELAEALRETVGVERRDTMATLGDDDLPSMPHSVVIRSAETTGSGMDKTIQSRRSAELVDDIPSTEPTESADAPEDEASDVAAISARKPSLTVRQFGTTQSISQRSNRAAIIGVGAAFLVIGLGATFVLMGGIQALGLETVEPPPAATQAPPEPPSSTQPANTPPPKLPEEQTGIPEAVEDAGDAAVRDAGRDASAVRGAGKDDAEPEPKSGARDASTDRDWGKTSDEPPEPVKPPASAEPAKSPDKPPDNPLPPPPPPIGGDK